MRHSANQAAAGSFWGGKPKRKTHLLARLSLAFSPDWGEPDTWWCAQEDVWVMRPTMTFIKHQTAVSNFLINMQNGDSRLFLPEPGFCL